MSTAILALNDMFGQDIQCHGIDGKADKAITQYCWISGTFTVPGRQDMGAGLGVEAGCCSLENQPDRGMCWDNASFAAAENNPKTTKRCRQTLNYYQWVPYMLVLQGALFLLPHKLWKVLEEGKMKCISEGVRTGNKGGEAERETIINNIAKFVAKQNKTTGHVMYAVSFMSCQVLSLLNVVFNFFLLNVFFEGEFLSFGQRWISSLDLDPANNAGTFSVLTDVFPKMTLCEWRQRGGGGGLEMKTFLCILATNIATEKVFIFLWFWFIVLFFITLTAIGYYCILFFSRDVTWRDHFLAIAVKSTKGAKNDSEKTKEDEVQMFLKDLPASKFFFLYLLGHNVDYISLKQIVQKISDINACPPGYRTTIKNRSMSTMGSGRQLSTMNSMSHQMSTGSGRQLSTRNSMRPQMSFVSSCSPSDYSRSSSQTDALEMKKIKPVVPQPGVD